jgi:hypothetical protein
MREKAVDVRAGKVDEHSKADPRENASKNEKGESGFLSFARNEAASYEGCGAQTQGRKHPRLIAGKPGSSVGRSPEIIDCCTTGNRSLRIDGQ